MIFLFVIYNYNIYIYSCGLLLEQVKRREHIILIGLDDGAIHHHLVEDEVRLLEVEHDVELADVLKVAAGERSGEC